MMREAKIVFVAHCLLNTNNKVKELARYPGMCKDVIDTLHDYGFGVTASMSGNTLFRRSTMVVHEYLYDNPGLENTAGTFKHPVDYMENYEQIGYKTVAV